MEDEMNHNQVSDDIHTDAVNADKRIADSSGADHSIAVRVAIIGLFVLALISFALIIYNAFIVTPEVRLVDGYRQLMKKIDADYDKVLKKMGLDVDASKDFSASITVDLKKPAADADATDRIQSIGTRWIQSDQYKLYQGLISYKIGQRWRPFLGVQIDDAKVSLMIPELNSNVYTLSSKNFGKEFNQFSKNMRWYYSQYSEVDFSYSRLRKIFAQRNDSRYLLQRYGRFLKELFQNLNIKREGNIYTCVILPERFQQAIDDAFNDAIEDFRDFDLYDSKAFLEMMKYSYIRYPEGEHMDANNQNHVGALTLEVTKDVSGRWDFKQGKTEVKLIEMKKEDVQHLMDEVRRKEEALLY